MATFKNKLVKSVEVFFSMHEKHSFHSQ